MGFRGEALASIASVARVEIASLRARLGARPRAARRGRRAWTRWRPAARAPGTTRHVEDLYFNTPARRKFMRTEATEFGHCDEVFRRARSRRPEIAFTLKHNGRVSRHFKGTARRRAGRARCSAASSSTPACQSTRSRGALRLSRPCRLAACGHARAPMRSISSSTAASCATACCRTRCARRIGAAARRPAAGVRAVPRARSARGGRERASREDRSALPRMARRSTSS